MKPYFFDSENNILILLTLKICMMFAFLRCMVLIKFRNLHRTLHGWVHFVHHTCPVLPLIIFPEKYVGSTSCGMYFPVLQIFFFLFDPPCI